VAFETVEARHLVAADQLGLADELVAMHVHSLHASTDDFLFGVAAALNFAQGLMR
jgi:hypothetical protein